MTKARPSWHATTTAVFGSAQPYRTNADTPRKLPSSSLDTAAPEALLEFLEITASILTFANPLGGLIHHGFGSPTFSFCWLLGLIISKSLPQSCSSRTDS